MQTDRTLQFWDTYHKENEKKEWISQPSRELLQVLQSQISLSNTQKGKILEIGCGTSTMARDLWQRLTDEGSRIEMCATDVSPICIAVCENRDKEITRKNNEFASLQYQVLNVLEDQAKPVNSQWNAILDKGCVDTFLFRSKNRGENQAYNRLLQDVLNNIWSLLSHDGVFLLISPRSKLKAIRDFSGFSSVERHALTKESKGELTGKKNEAEIPAYVYVCRKNLDYIIGKTPTYKVNFRDLPQDDAKCPNCDLTFCDLRKGEDVTGRGLVFWTRQWKAHCIHCKAPHKSKWNR